MVGAIRRSLALTIALAHPSLAAACEPYSIDGFRVDIASVDALLDAVNLPDADAQLASVADRLPCLTEMAPASDMARFALRRATVAFFGQDELLALRWARAAQFSDPAADWPALVADGHPVRTLAQDSGAPLWGGPDGGFDVDRRGAVVASGIYLARPHLPSEVPLLVQVFDRRGEAVQAHWQEGPAFPESLIGAQADPMDPPDWVVVTAPGLEVSDVAFAPIAQDPTDPMLQEEDEPPELASPVDDRPVEERAREAWEQAVWIADANPSIGRRKIQDFLDEFGDSGIAEVADAHRWMSAHPEPAAAVDEADEPEAEPERRARRERPQREPRGRTPRQRRPRSERRSEATAQIQAVDSQPAPTLQPPVVPEVVEQDAVVQPPSTAPAEPMQAVVVAPAGPAPADTDSSAVALSALRSANPSVRMTTTRDVVIDLAGVSGDTVCLSEKPNCRKPQPLQDTLSFRMTGRSGLHAVHVTVDGREGRSTHTAWFWLDARAPKLGTVTVVPDAGGWTVVATALSDADSRAESWIVGQASGRDEDDCSDVIAQGQSPAVWISRQQAQWNSLVFCAVDAAGNVSAPTKVKLDFDAQSTVLPWGNEPVNWYPQAQELPALQTGGPVCRNDKPTCRRFRNAAEVPPHQLSGSAQLQSAYTFTEADGEVSSVVRYAVVDQRPPSDGQVSSLASDDVVVVGWPGARDAETDVVGYRLVGDGATQPEDCESGRTLYEGPALWTTLPRGEWHVRVCAIDRVGNVSQGATARIRD